MCGSCPEDEGVERDHGVRREPAPPALSGNGTWSARACFPSTGTRATPPPPSSICAFRRRCFPSGGRSPSDVEDVADPQVLVRSPPDRHAVSSDKSVHRAADPPEEIEWNQPFLFPRSTPPTEHLFRGDGFRNSPGNVLQLELEHPLLLRPGAATGSTAVGPPATISSCPIASTARDTPPRGRRADPGSGAVCSPAGCPHGTFPAASTIRREHRGRGVEKGVSSMSTGATAASCRTAGGGTPGSPMTRGWWQHIPQARGGRLISTSRSPERGMVIDLDEVLLQIPRADRGDSRLHHRGVGRRKLLGQVAQHLEEEAAGPRMKRPAATPSIRNRPGAEDLTGVDHRLDGVVPRILPREHPEEDVPPDALGDARLAEFPGQDLQMPVGLRVGADEPHGEDAASSLRRRAEGPRRRRRPPRRSPPGGPGVRRGRGPPRGPGRRISGLSISLRISRRRGSSSAPPEDAGLPVLPHRSDPAPP